MFNYSRLNINILSFIISIILFNIFNIANDNIKYEINKKEEASYNQSQINNIDLNMEEKQEDMHKNEKINYNWGIYIHKIGLNAQISEGTTKEVMDKYVGHFVDTGVIKGNICLGAHNRGYPVNYFENIKSLEKGDYIYYKKGETNKVFEVETVTVIKDTDWTYLENTEDTRITLITCVENEPDYRRCIQAIEFKEEK